VPSPSRSSGLCLSLRSREDCPCTWHNVGSSRLVTGSHSSLEFDLLEQADPGALVQAIANLREPHTTTGVVIFLVSFGLHLRYQWGQLRCLEENLAASFQVRSKE
jgi:hypothetical protein